MPGGWSEFLLALITFFLSHAIPVRPPIRPWLVRLLGPRGFTAGYSLLSLALLAWLIVAAGRAPYIALWGWAPWQSWAALGVMLIVCLILAMAVRRPNPFSFGGRQGAGFDPARPGIIWFTRHPLLWALGLWAVAHVLPNGDLAHVLLFGLLGGFAFLGGRLIDHRQRRVQGPEYWTRQWQQVRDVARPYPADSGVLLLRLLAGLGLFVILLALHSPVIGVNPWPGF